MKSDIEIAQSSKPEKILDIAKKLDIPSDALEPYGHYKAKSSFDYIDNLSDKSDGKLILVTAISPTPAGEGKTTTSDSLCSIYIYKNAVEVIRTTASGEV